MNGYDFDDTIFKGNSFRRFFFYCLLRLPYLILYMPIQCFAAILHAIRILNKHAFLNVLERFILFVPCKRRFVTKFWDKNIKRVKRWYLNQRRDDDIIISASPQYLVEEACRRLNVMCIASPVDLRNGRTRGKHCHDVVKPVMYRDAFGDSPLATYYSDSFSDAPMFELAERGYLVKGETVVLLYENGRKVTDENG
ncbi:MAG: haloacid dehalogenase-like hydrolase [Corallococcus sp.]|nr:haloacid dehalogenase-like hydrolase [Corallococcus sp.]